MTHDAPRQDFAIPDVLRFESGRSGMTRAVVTHPLATGELYTHGAHVTAWQPAGAAPVLWMSERSHFAPDKPIRGGVPICFPWFGPKADDPSAPSHGTARLHTWRVDATAQDSEGVTIRLATTIEPWDLVYTVAFGRTLQLTLRVTHRGATPAGFEAALHTYLAVGDIREVTVRGLEHTPYLDSLAARQRVEPLGAPLRFSSETDRIYLDASEEVTVEDPQIARAIRVNKHGSRSTVVWNPWVAKSARMPDFGDDEWTGMLCIETANVAGDRVSLRPGESHEMSASLRVEEFAVSQRPLK